jgi:AcrR family transcriptional regulator
MMSSSGQSVEHNVAGSSTRRGAGAGTDARVRILDAAQRLFAESGYGATSTGKVATEAGVPAGLVFYYFSTKRELLLTLVRERAYRDGLRSLSVSAGDDEVEDVLGQAVGRLSELLRQHRDTQVILFREAHTHPELGALALDLVNSSTQDLADLLGRTPGVQAGEPQRQEIARLLIASLLLDNLLRPDELGTGRIPAATSLLATALRDSTRSSR